MDNEPVPALWQPDEAMRRRIEALDAELDALLTWEAKQRLADVERRVVDELFFGSG